MSSQAKEAIYLWAGTNSQQQPVRGQLLANNLNQAKAKLRSQGVLIKTIKRQPRPSWFNRVTSKDLRLFSRQLATLLKAGVPLVQSFAILQEGQTKPSLSWLLADLHRQVAAGKQLAEAFSAHPKVFNQLYCSLIEAGEASGTLETLLETLASYQERQASLKAKIKKAVFYPCWVLLIGLGVAAVLLTQVVPEFEKMFAGLGADLPRFTQGVLNLSRSLQASGSFWLAALLAFSGLMVFWAKRSPSLSFKLSRLALRLPVFGQLLHKTAVARFASTLATCFAAGLPLVNALQAAGKATGNLVYQLKINALANEVMSGQALHQAMRADGLFPSLVVQMVALGEESGALDTLLIKVAEFYEEEVNNLVDSLMSLLEPLVILILGVLVGGLVLAIYLPIFQMGELF